MSIFNKKLFNLKKKDTSPNKILIPQKEEMLFNGVNMDINNKCNQRCRFCFNSYNEDSVNMDLETYSHMLEVIPFVKNYEGGGYGFYFSCSYEPTVHPQFLEYLEMLPPEAKNKCFFTTNLLKPMDENFIESMLTANIFLINISIETFNPKRFEYITQSKQFDHFKNNLSLLEKVINNINTDLPQIRFITILLNENKDEIIDLIKYGYAHFPLESYEIRTPYISIYNNMEWNKKQLLQKNEADEIITKIKDLNCHTDVNIESIENLKDLDKENSSNIEDMDIYEKVQEKFNEVEDVGYLFSRINPDGTYFDKLTINPEPIDLNDSTKYFRDKLIKLYAHKAEVAYCSSYNDNEVINGDAEIFIDNLSENDVFIELTGWCCPDRKINTDKLIIKLSGKEDDIHYFYTSTKKRFDVDEYKQKEKGWCAGFSTYIGKSNLKEKEYFVNFLFKDYSGKTICYSMEHILLI